MLFWPHFRLFFKNYNTEFLLTRWKCSPYCFRAIEKNRRSKSFSLLEIFSLKVGIFGQNGENEVQRSGNISRTVNAMKNPIWYSKSTKNYLSDYCHQIFPYSSSSGWKFDLKTVNFQFFAHFLNDLRPFSRQLLQRFSPNLLRKETKWIQSRCKRPDSNILSHLGDI